MGKNLTQQKRGKGSNVYKAPSFKYKGKAGHNRSSLELMQGKIIDIVHCRGHTGPLAEISYENDEKTLSLAPEGIKVGDTVESGAGAGLKTGNTLNLKDIPEGTLIYNIESNPGDGGKFVRSSGAFARVLTKLKDRVIVQLPSKKQKNFALNCRASIGIVSGGGRTEKPFLKAGNKSHKMRKTNKLYPHVCGQSMNAVDHPHGGTNSAKKNTPSSYSTPRNAPPGRKVGKIAPKRTGRRRGKA